MNDAPQNTTVETYFSTKMFLCVGLGFSSGLPLYFVLQLIPAWLRTEQIDLKQISLLALAGLPWSWKFIWAPLLDRWHLTKLGKRRSWMLLSQISLAALMAAMSLLDPGTQIQMIAVFTLLLAFFSATQDIALDAYRRELLDDKELGLGNSLHVYTYRISSLIPGSLSLFLADYFSWSSSMLVTACFMLVGLITAALAPEPQHQPEPVRFQDSFIQPLEEFFSRKGWRHALLLLTFLFFYKLGDNLATALAQPFYLDMGFSLTEIALIAKHAALWPSIVGGLVGGIWMLRIGINRALWWFGWIQLLAILGYAALTYFPGSRWALAAAISVEYFGVGLGTAAFTAFIASTTSKQFAATQFALLTALATLPRSVANAFAGHLVEAVGWERFFYLCTVLALPGLLLVFWVAPWRKHNNVKSD